MIPEGNENTRKVRIHRHKCRKEDNEPPRPPKFKLARQVKGKENKRGGKRILRTMREKRASPGPSKNVSNLARSGLRVEYLLHYFVIETFPYGFLSKDPFS